MQKQWDTPPKMTINKKKKYTAILKTNMGDIEIELFAKHSPITVNNFVFLAREGFYDGLIFHRVIKDFMLQTGCPMGIGIGGPGYEFEDEKNTYQHEIGAVSMANAGPDTNGSQFFIVHKFAQAHLDGKHTVFGKVREGMEVVNKIAESEVDYSDRPEEDVVIKKVEIKEEDAK